MLNRHQVAFPWVENSEILVTKGDAGLTGNLYVGLMEFSDMAFLLHCLRPEDLFIDVGANVGAYTVLASKVIGARTIAFEPIAQTVEKLKVQIAHNHIDEITEVRCIGLGSDNEVLRFSKNYDTVNRVVLDHNSCHEFVEVDVRRLDDQLADINTNFFIKIDVEGFELNVLKGAANLLKSDRLLALIIETNGSGKGYGVANEDIHHFLSKFGLEACSYDPLKRTLMKLNRVNQAGLNTIYVNSYALVSGRCGSAHRYTIHTAGQKQI